MTDSTHTPKRGRPKKDKPVWPVAKPTRKKAVSKPRQTVSGKTIIAKTEASPIAPVKRGRPKLDQESPFLYLESDFYLVRSPEGYAAAAEDWWGETPPTLSRAPEEFPAIVAFFERTSSGPKIQSTYAPRKSLGFTKDETREVEPQVRVVEKIVEVEKIVTEPGGVIETQVEVEKIVEVPVEVIVEVAAEPTFWEAVGVIFAEIRSHIPFL